MADRNDELLLALGWVYGEVRRENPARGHYKTFLWKQPNGKIYNGIKPRPYDNLQDAVDCVPEGLEVQLKWRSGGDYGHAVLHNPETDALHFAMQATPAEALSEAIMKAVK